MDIFSEQKVPSSKGYTIRIQPLKVAFLHPYILQKIYSENKQNVRDKVAHFDNSLEIFFLSANQSSR